MEVSWLLPTRGDGRDVGPVVPDRGHDAAALHRRPVLSGYPHLEEAWRVGEQVLPLLGRAPATASA